MNEHTKLNPLCSQSHKAHGESGWDQRRRTN